MVHAETKDHENWELLGKVAEVATGNTAKVLKEAHEKVEKDEDHHLYHSKWLVPGTLDPELGHAPHPVAT